MKSLLLLLMTLVLIPAQGAEKFRVWTDTKGRTVKARLMDKGDGKIEIMLPRGRRTTLRIDDISEADQKYVEAADVLPAPEMVAKTMGINSKALGEGTKAYKVGVEVTNVRGRTYELVIHWLGPDEKTVAIYKTETKTITEDSRVEFEVGYNDKDKDKDKKPKKGQKEVKKTAVPGDDYKGYVVGLKDLTLDPKVDDVWIAKSANQKPFERFLDPDEEE